MVPESEVTNSIGMWLQGHGWKIESMALPAGGGLEIRRTGAKLRSGERGLIPDVIASDPQRGILVVECKPEPDLGDAAKLSELIEGPYDEHLRFLFRTDPRELTLAVGFGLPIHSANTARQLRRAVGLAFGVGADRSVRVEWNDVAAAIETE